MMTYYTDSGGGSALFLLKLSHDSARWPAGFLISYPISYDEEKRQTKGERSAADG